MRLPILFLCSLATLHAADSRHPQKLTFAGATYERAFRQASPNGALTVEYVPAGETLKSWSSMVAYREWPEKDLLKVTNAWLQMVGPLLARKPVFMKSEAEVGKEELIVDAWLAAPDKSYVEINLYRFIPASGSGGVKAYQFAIKVRKSHEMEDLRNFLVKRSDFITALCTVGKSTMRNVATIEAELEQAEGELVDLRSRYKERYLGIRKKLAQIEMLKGELAAAKSP